MIASQVFPQDADSRDNYQELVPEIMDYVQANNVAVSNALTLPPVAGLSVPEKSGAAMVMIFKDETSQKNIAWIALKPAKKPGAYPIFLQTKQFSDLTGYVQLSGKKGEEDKISGVQQRALTNLKPVGILPTNVTIAVDDIPTQVQGTIQGRDDLADNIKQQVVQLLEAVAAGSSNPIPGAGDYAKSYEIDLGETAAPISLVKKKFLSGAWQQAEAGMGLKFESASGVEFPNDPAEKLYDSYLKFPSGTSSENGAAGETIIRVSSKDKQGGASASVSGVVDDIANYPERFEGLFDPAVNPGFDKLLEITKVIKDPDMSYVSASKRWKRNGSIASVLQLGVSTATITTEQSTKLLSIIDSDQQHVSEEEMGDLKSILSLKGTDDNTRPDYRIGWHLLAGVATGIANKVNTEYKTDAFFKAVLERSNMLQVKTSLTQKPSKDAEGNPSSGAYFSNFEVIYPPVFTGTIKLDASKNYGATRPPIGKMGFTIKPTKTA
jgi:hypothetical protein